MRNAFLRNFLDTTIRLVELVVDLEDRGTVAEDPEYRPALVECHREEVVWTRFP